MKKRISFREAKYRLDGLTHTIWYNAYSTELLKTWKLLQERRNIGLKQELWDAIEKEAHNPAFIMKCALKAKGILEQKFHLEEHIKNGL
jgi:hypothetical protein